MRKRWGVLASLAVVLLPGRTTAQLLSTRSLFESPFYATNSAPGLLPRLLAPLRERLGGGRDRFALTLFTSETVRTRQAGVPVGDLYGSGGLLNATFGAGRAVSGEIFLARSEQHGLFVDDSKRRTTADTHLEEWAGEVNFRVGSGRAYLAYDQMDSRLRGRSDLVTAPLPILPGTPDIVWNTGRREITAGLVQPLSSRLTLEAAGAWQELPGSLGLSANRTQVTLPMTSAGLAWSMAMQVRADRKMDFFAFWQRADRTGRGDARRDALALGQTAANSREESWGAAVRRQFGGNATASLSFARTGTRLNSQAFGLDPGPLGLDSGSVTQVGYFFRGELARREIGAQWTQRFSPNHGMEFAYRWIESPLHLEYGYTATAFLTGLTQARSLDYPDARGHLLRLRYTFPARPVTITLDLSQIIPVPLARQTQAITPPSSGPPRRASGGWDIFLTVAYPL